MSPLRQQLVEVLRNKALRHLDEPVQLASGEWSSDFIDCKEGLSAWSDLLLASKAMTEVVHDAGLSFDAVGGLTMGADAITVGIASVANCNWFLVRKEPKGRGTRRYVEGRQIGSGNDVLLVDDVVTSGGSILKAYNVVVDTGANVIAAVTLVDRSTVAGSTFKELEVPYFPMATFETLEIAPVGLDQQSLSTAV